MLTERPTRLCFVACLLACALFAAVGCRSAGNANNTGSYPQTAGPHPTTLELDSYDPRIAELYANSDRRAYQAAKLELYSQRWSAVQRAVAHHGVMHRDAFYGSRSYWYTGSTAGLSWTIDQQGDLDQPAFVDGRGNVRVTGDVNSLIEVTDSAIIHIYGDLDGTLDLTGVCEVVIAGSISEDATIITDGQLELFVGGNSAGIFGSTGSSTIVIDGNAAGVIQCGAPASTITVIGDLVAEVPPPDGRDAVLTLRVDGFMPGALMQDIADAGFTRVNATLGSSDVPPGLYPTNQGTTRPTARWTVLEQRAEVDAP